MGLGFRGDGSQTRHVRYASHFFTTVTSRTADTIAVNIDHTEIRRRVLHGEIQKFFPLKTLVNIDLHFIRKNADDGDHHHTGHRSWR